MKRITAGRFGVAVAILTSVAGGATAMDVGLPAGIGSARYEAGVGSSAARVAVTLSVADAQSDFGEANASIPRSALGQARFEVDSGLEQAGFRSLTVEIGYSWRW